MKALIAILISSIFMLSSCSKEPISISDNTIPGNEEANVDIFSYLPTFIDSTDETISGTMKDYTFIYIHCDNEGNWAYIQDFMDKQSTSPLYLYQFTNPITASMLLNEMPERSKDFEVDSRDIEQVDNFYDHLSQVIDDNWPMYKKGDYLFRYANVQNDGYFYNEKRIYKNNKPYCFIHELSDPYTINDIEVSNDAYIWLARG